MVDGTLQFLRRNGGIRWADAFVRFLRIRLLGLELARCVGEAFCTIEVVDGAADGGDGFIRQRHAVRTHVGDETDRAFAEVLAFVQLLRHLHGLARGEAQAVRRCLLQGAGAERWLRVAAARLLFHAGHA